MENNIEQCKSPFIERLLQGAEVEWKPLGEISTQISGMNGVSNKWAETGNCRFIDYLNAYKHLKIDINQLPFATVKTLNQTELQQGDILFTSASEKPEECAISSVIEDEIVKGVFLDDHLFGIRINEVNKDIVDPVFLNYYFHSPDFRKMVNKTVRGVTRFYISKVSFMKLSVPIPPLSVQHKIVEILDKFTELEAELEAELDCRKRQYEYYRNQLLSFDMLNRGQKLNSVTILQRMLNGGTVEWKKLGEVAELKRGNTITKKTSTEGKYPVISGGKQPAYYINSFNRDGETVTIAGSGAYAGYVMFWNEPIFVSDAFSIKVNNEQILPRYIYHFLLNIQDKIHALKSGGGVPHVYAKDVARFPIPLPPLSVQREIVEILDKFDTLTNSISEGLPKEIELRRKQYEYYRNQLLTFAQ